MDNLNLKMNLGQYLSVIYVCFISININVTFYEHHTDNKKNKSTVYFFNNLQFQTRDYI